ncbi:MAG: ABC transporter ATP-binding protein [Calditrichales bacterium]|nr:MAG: ABC transporter ATP-binding protein [Calditrichales bacterium]
MNHSNSGLKLENVRYAYPDGTEAVRDVSFCLNKNEKIALIGPNGAGKSTLVTLLNGVIEAKGVIEILGTPLKKRNHSQLKSKIGIVFQNPEDQLFCPSIYEDVAFGPLNFGMDPGKIKSAVRQALSEVGLEGYEQRASLNLSFGEKKLASIATILSFDPEVIVMDEPTSNLDPHHRRKIINWIKEHEHTILLATHDLDMAAEVTDRVLIMNQGCIVAEGKTRQILTDQRLLEENGLELPLSLQTCQWWES